MAYKTNEYASTFGPTGSQGLNTDSDLARASSPGDFYELESAEVIDVIRDSDHPEFKGFEDIGKVRFRFIYSQKNRPESQLFLARPLSANIQKYPLRHEIVLVGKFLGNFYYVDVVNHLLNQNHNDLANVSVDPTLKTGSTNTQQNYRESGVGDTSPSNSDVSVGDVFEINDDFKPLDHDEGDVIIEGRFSNSIRLGSNQDTGNPTIKIRCGQYEDASNLDYLEPIYEDINQDPSSIYLSQDGVLDLEPSTRDSETHLSSAENPPSEYGGNQILSVSDRIVLDAKKNQIMLFAKGDINLNSASDFTLDVDGNVMSNIVGDRTHETRGSITSNIQGDLNVSVGGTAEHDISERVVWNVPEMYFGEQDQSEPIVLGQTLVGILNDLLTAIQQQTHTSPVGPTGPPINAAQFASIQNQLQTILSQRNFTQ